MSLAEIIQIDSRRRAEVAAYDGALALAPLARTGAAALCGECDPDDLYAEFCPACGGTGVIRGRTVNRARHNTPRPRHLALIKGGAS